MTSRPILRLAHSAKRARQDVTAQKAPSGFIAAFNPETGQSERLAYWLPEGATIKPGHEVKNA